MLKLRILTAILLIVPLVAAVVWLPSRPFAILLGAVVTLAAWEWARLAGLQQPGRRLLYCALVVLVMLLCALALPAVGWQLVIGLGLLFWLGALLAVIGFEQGHWQRPWSAVLLCCLGLLILVPAWLALVALHAAPAYGPYWVLSLFVLIWLADSSAYFCGRRWGRRRLAATVSPGKTLAGLAGALVAVALLALAAAAAMAEPLQLDAGDIAGLLLLAVVTVLLSVLGDLTESLFKRLAGVKDSGHILPGHGGILDRIDSLTAAAPLYLAGLWLLGVYK